MNKNFQKAFVTTYVLVFGAIFLVLIGGLFSLILFQLKLNVRRIAWNESLQIAEAGVGYYHWCLNNEAQDNCQTEKNYFDLEGNALGEFSLTVTAEVSCSETAKREMESRGWTNEFSDVIRKIKTSYGRETVAKYSFLINDNVWAGADLEIRGPYHSNGGIRMDGENQSIVTSAKEDWLCTSSFGCSWSSCPSDCVGEGSACRCPGVFTTTGNANQDLFSWPVPYFDFESITIDLARVKARASPFPQEKYWPPSTQIDASAKGYHLKFDQSGTVGIWIITGLTATEGYSLEEGWQDDYFTINNEYLYKTVALDPSCSVIFVEDNLWVEGKVKGKTILVSADLLDPAKDTSVVLPSDIEYASTDGSDGLAVLGEKNVLIAPNSPDVMELRGIFIAQKGRFGRNHYPSNIKTSLEIHGAIVSNGRVGTKWTSGSAVVSGYRKRENYVDPNLVYSAPAFVPTVSSNFDILEWEEAE